MTLLPFERRWLLTVFETVLPGGAHPRVPSGASDTAMDRFLADLVAHAPTHFLLGLRLCIWFVMAAPPFVLGKLRSFSGLGQDDRLRLLDRLAESNIYVVREMPLLFKTVACLGFCGLPDVQTRIGIHPVDAVPPDWARRSLPMRGADR